MKLKPASEMPDSPRSETSQRLLVDAEKPIILYVDDEEANRVVFEKSFMRNFPIRLAASGYEALEILKNETIGVLVTDQRMPNLSGNELLQQTRQLYPDVVRVVMTAYGDLDPILAAVNEGLVARYIVKPWEKNELEQVLKWAVEAYKLGHQSSALQLRLMQTERLVTLGSIGAAVMHDLNQPLSYLLGNSERLAQLSKFSGELGMLVKRYEGDLSPEGAQALSDLANELPDIIVDMLEGCRVMQDLTGSIRRMIRPHPDSGPRITDPIPVLRYAVSVCRQIAMVGRGSVLYEGPKDLPKVCMSSTALHQVLINLAANAAQALARRPNPGGRVTLSAIEVPEGVRFCVADDGPGMSPEVLSKVGTPFFSTRQEGTGLGVSQCRRLIEREGARLHIESREGVGTTVSFILGRAQD